MKTGTYISGIGHGAFILWVLFGGFFLRAEDLPPIEVTEVSLISGAQFAALTAPDSNPEAELNVPSPVAPEIDQSVPVAPSPESQPDIQAAPQAASAPDIPEEAPDVAEIQPLPEAELVDVAPEALDQPVEGVLAALPIPNPTTPSDAPRVAPTPAPQPEPEREIAPEVSEEAVPDAEAEVVVEEDTATAPEAATTQIITEATETTTEVASAAPQASPKPRVRPRRPVPERVQTPTPVTTPAAEAETETVQDTAVSDALREALATPTETRAPAGPPLTRGEKDALRVAVSACWNVGSLSSEALRTTVVVSVAMASTGKPDSGSIRLLSSTGGSTIAARQAFEAARRAILRCGAKGFDLPAEKYEQWRDIEMTFNPEKMRIK